MDLVLGDQFVSQMFGQQMVRPDHVVSVSTILGGYNAKRFLEKTPNSTKVIAVLLKDFKMESFNRRDGSSGINVQASCDGYQVIHYSSKHKASDVKQCNLPESKPFYIKDRTNGASGSQQNVQQQGTGTVPPNAFSQPVPMKNSRSDNICRVTPSLITVGRALAVRECRKKLTKIQNRFIIVSPGIN